MSKLLHAPEKNQPRPAPQPDSSEAGLIERIRNGESELFYELIQPHERSVYLAAFSVLQNPADAEEIAQEAILKAFKYLANFRGESKFSTWLIRITINEAHMRHRKLHRELFESLEDGKENEQGDYIPRNYGDWREIPSESLERKEVQEILAEALAALPEKYREVLVLRDIRQLSIAEAAQALGIREGAIKTRLLRARLQMRDLIAPHLKTLAPSSNWFKKGKKPWS